MSENTKKENKILKFNDLCLEVEKFHQELLDIEKLSKSLKNKIEKFNFDVFDILNQNEKMLFLSSLYTLDVSIYEKFIISYMQYLSLNK